MLKEIQATLQNKTPKVFGAILRKYPEYKAFIQKQTAFLDVLNPTIAHRLYHLFNNITSIPMCANCGQKYAKFNSYNKGYVPYCGVKCSNSHTVKKQKTQDTWNNKYGSKEGRAEHLRKIAPTVSPFFDPEFQRTNNGGNYAWTEEVRAKREDTCLKKYGVKHTAQAEQTKETSRKTHAKKYKNGHAMRDPEVMAKREKVFTQKYGVPNPRQNENVKARAKQTCLEKYGVPNAAQRHIQHIDLWHDDEYIKNTFLNENGTIRYKEMMAFFGCEHTSGIRDRLQRLGIPYKPYTGYSAFEDEIELFLKQSIPGIIIQRNNRTTIKPYEIDVYLPEYNVGIEFHGLIWHSFGSQPNNAYLETTNKHKHKTKADIAANKSITLLQIFENEWHVPIQQRIWKSVILSKLNKTHRIYARKCTIQNVTHKQSTAFLRDNHLQQNMVGAKTRIALLHNGRIVSLMTFGKSRFAKNEYELLRFCNLQNTTVVGAFSRLLKHFIKIHGRSMIVSYANRRWSNGAVYKHNGFVEQHTADPGYYYLHQSDTTRVYHRIVFQKHKLKKLLKTYDAALTETENMYANGYRKIYDAGQIKYVVYT